MDRMERMDRLIVNADDFGISEGVNRGILEGYAGGIITSTTVMANMPAFEHAVDLWKEHSALAVGVHLSLSAGEPALDPSLVPSLVGADGRFLRLDLLLARLSLGRVDPRQLEAELAAQVERAARAGLPLTHLDSHHHVHLHPGVQPLVIQVALRYGLRGIRCPVELSFQSSVLSPQSPGLGTQPLSLLKAMVASLLGTLLRRRAQRVGLVAPDHFRGGLLGSAFSAERLRRVLLRLPAGSTELMCHPGYPDEALRRETSYAEGRERELAALLDPEIRALLDRAGTRLGSYADLSGLPGGLGGQSGVPRGVRDP